MMKATKKARECVLALQLLAVVVLTLFGNVSLRDYADDVCNSQVKDKVFGFANVTATDGIALPMRYECDSLSYPHIQTCSFATSPNAKVKAKSTEVILADIGNRFYFVSCFKTERPTIKPAEFLAKLCIDDLVAMEENLKSASNQAAPETPTSKEAVDVVKVSSTAITVNVSYTVSCFGKPGISSCSFAGGNRLRSPVAIAPENSGYIMQDGTDYSLACDKFDPPSVSPVSKTYADELCKETVSVAWAQTVKSDYSSYPTQDQLVLKKEVTHTVGKSSIPIMYEVQCFGEPVRVQRCSFARGGRLMDTIAIPTWSNGAYIRQGDKEFTLKCSKFTSAKISAKENTGADGFCEDAIQLKEKEKKEQGASFSLKEDEVTTKVLSLERPSFGTKLKVEVKALCFGNRPMFQFCRMKRKGNKAVVSAGYRGVCVDVGIWPTKAMARLDCDEFDLPRFTTKKEKMHCT